VKLKPRLNQKHPHKFKSNNCNKQQLYPKNQYNLRPRVLDKLQKTFNNKNNKIM